MKINIFGSTGVIGKKTLELIDKDFTNIKINLICAKSNYQLLKKQIYKYNPKYAFLYDMDKLPKINNKINKTKILNFNELKNYLLESKSNLTVLAISHNLKSLSGFDKIIEMEDGNIKQIGNYLDIDNIN